MNCSTGHNGLTMDCSAKLPDSAADHSVGNSTSSILASYDDTNCSSSDGVADHSMDVTSWIQVTCLLLFAGVTSSSNVCLLVRLGRRHRRLYPFERLLKAQCIWGVVLVLNVVPIHVTMLVIGTFLYNPGFTLNTIT